MSIRKIIAFIFDLLFSFIAFGFLIGALTGGLSESGFSLEGLPALILFSLVIAYFILANKFLGTSVGKLILGVKKAQAAPGDNQPPQSPIPPPIPSTQPTQMGSQSQTSPTTKI